MAEGGRRAGAPGGPSLPLTGVPQIENLPVLPSHCRLLGAEREGSTILTEGRNQSLPTRTNRGASTSPAIQAHVQTPWPAVHPSVHPTPGPKDPALSLGSLCTTSPTRHRASATGQSTLRAAGPPGVCTRHLPRRRSVPGSDRGRLRARGRNRPG